MKIRSITFAALRQGERFENDRLEVTVDVAEGDDPNAAYLMAKRFVLGRIKLRDVDEAAERPIARREMRQATERAVARSRSRGERPLDLDGLGDDDDALFPGEDDGRWGRD